MPRASPEPAPPIPAAALAARAVRRQVVLEAHDLGPRGRFAVVVRRVTLPDHYRSHLWRVALPSGRTLPLTSGPVRDTLPRISPDGRLLAFLRSRPDRPGDPAAVMLLPLGGGEPRLVVRPAHGAGALAWAPDGRRLAFTAPADPPRFLVGASAGGRGSPLARRITRIDWRLDGVGHRDRREHLFVVPAREGGRPQRLTRGDHDVRDPAWAPDGSSIAFAADRGEDQELHPRTTIWRIPAAGGAPKEVLALAGPVTAPAWSPDGRWLAVVGTSEADPADDVLPGLFVGPADGTGPARPLAPGFDWPVGVFADTDLAGWTANARAGPQWCGGERVVALVSRRGRVEPWAFAVDPQRGGPDGPPRSLGSGDLLGWSLAASQEVVTVLAADGLRAPELLSLELPAAAGRRRPPGWRRRTATGSSWQRALPRVAVAQLEAPGPAGPVPLFVVAPPQSAPGPLPLVVDVHGGPVGAWGPTPPLEALLLAGRGYRVVLPNIRGSASYGRAWTGALLGGRWGDVDAADVHAVVDHCCALGLADPERVGVMGLSYGGFLTQWLVATSRRFRAAVAENGVANQVSAYANCDTGPLYNRAAGMGDTLSPEGVATLWRQSPLAHAADITTPLLMLQAEADLRCPPQDNEQLFVALRILGRPVEYVLYPEESHTYMATGRPDRRIDRMTRVLEWFDRHLVAAPSAQRPAPPGG